LGPPNRLSLLLLLLMLMMMITKTAMT